MHIAKTTTASERGAAVWPVTVLQVTVWVGYLGKKRAKEPSLIFHQHNAYIMKWTAYNSLGYISTLRANEVVTFSHMDSDFD